MPLDKSTANGAKIIHYDDNGDDAVQWKLEPVNDVVFKRVGQLYGYAKAYKPKATAQQHWELTLAFIRRETYNNLMWILGVGSVDNGFVDYVAKKDSTLLEAFGKEKYTMGNCIYDKSNKKIDFYHLCATLNGLVHGELIGEETRNQMVGWAGDLQQLVPEVMNKLKKEGKSYTYDNIYNKAYTMLADGTSVYLGHADLYADADAANIYSCLNHMIMESFEDYFEYYYDTAYKQRFTLFTQSWSKEQIKGVVEKYLSNVLVLGEFKWLTKAQREAFRDAFTNYIWKLVTSE